MLDAEILSSRVYFCISSGQHSGAEVFLSVRLLEQCSSRTSDLKDALVLLPVSR